MTKEQILAEAMALDPLEREEVADALLTSLTSARRAEIDAAWLRECHRRAAEIERGEVVPLSGEQVMRDARQAVREARQ